MKSLRNTNMQGSTLACIIIGATAMTPVLAQKAGTEERLASPFSAELSVGAEYDSNVSVAELDTNTGGDDFAAVIDVDLGFEKDLSENTEISAGYSFSQSLHDQFTNFDIQTHFASAGLSHDFGAVDAGASYRFIYSSLGGTGFLQMQQIEPYVTKFFGKKMFVRAAYTYTDKDFKNRTDRDAMAHAGGADIYWFVDGVRTYFVTGYKYESQDAVDPQFDYNAHKIKVRFSQRIPMGKRYAKLKLGWRYETRDYSSITPSIGVIRNDDRHRLGAEIEIPVTDKIYTLLEYEYSDYTSNLPSADYTQSLAGLKLGVRF
ncbi:MAG: DUF560 domain-containing protein [Marinicaulis sp.]|nr:DUF560 domain-containing protein [Marinicaulis sp.]